MSGKRKVNDLQTALELFARHANGLTAENLEIFPGILEALFDEDALADPGERLRLAERVLQTIVGAINDCKLARDRHVGNALFAIDEDLHDKGVLTRVNEVHVAHRTYYDRRKVLLSRVARELRKEFSRREIPVSGVVLSPEAHRAARQLYRYAQQALVLVEAFGLCTDYAVKLLVAFAEARVAQADPEDLPHGWLAKYGNKGEDVRLVPASRTDESDQGLWALAYVYRYLRRLLQDRAGRVYVRESLPPESWESIQLRPAFAPDETDKMLSVLEEGQLDSPKVFVNDLCKDSQGGAIHEHWLKLLAAQSVAPSGDEFAALAREETVRDLLMLCIALQDVFPEETLLAPGEDFESTVPSIIYQVAEELGASVDGGGETAAVSALWDAILKYSPPRYVVEEGGQNREQVWNDRPSIPGVWAGLPVCRAWAMRPESEDPEREVHEMWIVVIPGSGLGFDCPEL